MLKVISFRCFNIAGILNTINEHTKLISELRETYFSQNDAAIVPFLGAGTSKLNGIPTWDTLVVAYHKEMSCPIDYNDLKNKHNNDLPSITEDIFNSTGANIPKYQNFLLTNIRSTETRAHSLSIKIVKYFGQIITTNFDNVLTDTAQEMKTLGISFDDHTELVYPSINALDFSGNVIAYLHGKISHKQFIFRKQEYLDAYRDSQINIIKDFLRAILKKKKLLFIGFSFDDREFKETLQEVIQEIRHSSEKFEKTFGRVIPETLVKGLYVILEERYLEEKITNNLLSELGVRIDSNFLKLFTQMPDGSYDFLGSNRESMRLTLEQTNNTTVVQEFIKRLNRIEQNRINMEYFRELGFSILTYKRDRLEVEKLIERIVLETSVSEDLNEAANI